eukprot:3914301-Prymnesium_polylepis.1
MTRGFLSLETRKVVLPLDMPLSGDVRGPRGCTLQCRTADASLLTCDAPSRRTAPSRSSSQRRRPA